MSSNQPFRKFGGINRFKKKEMINNDTIHTNNLTVRDDTKLDGITLIECLGVGQETFEQVDCENFVLDVSGNTRLSGSVQGGYNTQAKSAYSHTEGYETIVDASGVNYYLGDPNNYNTTGGEYAHAEGNQTKAHGYASHAEGCGAVSKGDQSHAEGFSTLTLGSCSHAEGHKTVAYNNYMHATGQLNKDDPNTYNNADVNFVVGSGVDDTLRKDALVVLEDSRVLLNPRGADGTTNSANVGIGTIDPAATLDVSGNMKLRGPLVFFDGVDESVPSTGGGCISVSELEDDNNDTSRYLVINGNRGAGGIKLLTNADAFTTGVDVERVRVNHGSGSVRVNNLITSTSNTYESITSNEENVFTLQSRTQDVDVSGVVDITLVAMDGSGNDDGNAGVRGRAAIALEPSGNSYGLNFYAKTGDAAIDNTSLLMRLENDNKVIMNAPVSIKPQILEYSEYITYNTPIYLSFIADDTQSEKYIGLHTNITYVGDQKTPLYIQDPSGKITDMNTPVPSNTNIRLFCPARNGYIMGGIQTANTMLKFSPLSIEQNWNQTSLFQFQFTDDSSIITESKDITINDNFVISFRWNSSKPNNQGFDPNDPQLSTWYFLNEFNSDHNYAVTTSSLSDAMNRLNIIKDYNGFKDFSPDLLVSNDVSGNGNVGVKYQINEVDGTQKASGAISFSNTQISDEDDTYIKNVSSLDIYANNSSAGLTSNNIVANFKSVSGVINGITSTTPVFLKGSSGDHPWFGRRLINHQNDSENDEDCVLNEITPLYIQSSNNGVVTMNSEVKIFNAETGTYMNSWSQDANHKLLLYGDSKTDTNATLTFTLVPQEPTDVYVNTETSFKLRTSISGQTYWVTIPVGGGSCLQLTTTEGDGSIIDIELFSMSYLNITPGSFDSTNPYNFILPLLYITTTDNQANKRIGGENQFKGFGQNMDVSNNKIIFKTENLLNNVGGSTTTQHITPSGSNGSFTVNDLVTIFTSTQNNNGGTNNYITPKQYNYTQCGGVSGGTKEDLYFSSQTLIIPQDADKSKYIDLDTYPTGDYSGNDCVDSSDTNAYKWSTSPIGVFDTLMKGPTPQEGDHFEASCLNINQKFNSKIKANSITFNIAVAEISDQDYGTIKIETKNRTLAPISSITADGNVPINTVLQQMEFLNQDDYDKIYKGATLEGDGTNVFCFGYSVLNENTDALNRYAFKITINFDTNIDINTINENITLTFGRISFTGGFYTLERMYVVYGVTDVLPDDITTVSDEKKLITTTESLFSNTLHIGNLFDVNNNNTSLAIGKDNELRLYSKFEDSSGNITSVGTNYSRIFSLPKDNNDTTNNNSILTIVGTSDSDDYTTNPCTLNVNTINTTTVTASEPKSFRIPHPLNETDNTSAKSFLYHSCVEGPDVNNIYNGQVTFEDEKQEVTVNLDKASRMTEGTWVALNKHPKIFLQNNSSFTRVKGSITGNILTIIRQECNEDDTIDWLVITKRNDASVIGSKHYDDDNEFISERDT